VKILLFYILIILVWGAINLPAHSADYIVKNGNKESSKPDAKIPISENDLKVLHRTGEFLKIEKNWNRHDDRECPPAAVKLSLYCALWKASEEINGYFDHRLGAMEELRRTVEEFSKGKTYEHRLMDWNNDPATTFIDVQKAIRMTEIRISKRLKAQFVKLKTKSKPK
jgi:hypothetical protein